MQLNLLSLTILCFFSMAIAAPHPQLLLADRISISCGSAEASTSLYGKQWLGDLYPNLSSAIAVRGSSTKSSAEPEFSVDPIPYSTARISRSQFSYTFQLDPGQKIIILHFNPASYYAFQRFNDFFTVEAGPFTLLANFSASIIADALAVNTVVKEFCVIIQENQPLDIVFTPISPSNYNYAFINGIEIIYVPSNLKYCHGGDTGVQVVGSKSVIYTDNSTALEMVHRHNINWGCVKSGDDITAMFGMSATIAKLKANRVNTMSCRVPVDVGFWYLVRIHFCELGLRMVEAGRKDFALVINQITVSTSSDVLQEGGNQCILLYKNYMVIVEGQGKLDISVSLQSNHVFLDTHGPLEGIEVFKLSNHDYNLASPNPMPPNRKSPLQPIQILLSILGRRNVLATVVFSAICLVNIIVYMLQQTWGANITEDENKQSTQAKRRCRRFSLAEIQSATDDFHDRFCIGRGGFGKVYKGLVDNGLDILAIKRLKPDSKQGKREFWVEVETLSDLRHVNLVSLIGYCYEQQEMILVYEYMPNGTLADHLYKLARKNMAYYPLSWRQRLEICIAAGRGLDYLHTGQENGIIHRDVKASNILLDEKFVAKVSDFGLAKIKSGSKLQDDASTNLKGTFGYMDPAYFRTHRLTTESDTYSFGVVLLEVLCGRPAVEPLLGEDKRSLTMWAREIISKGQLDHIIDPCLREEISPDSLKTFVKVADKCLLDEPKKRPAMAHVVMNLQFALEQQDHAESFVHEERARITEILKDMISSLPNERPTVTEVAPHANNFQREKSKSLLPKDEIRVADDRTNISASRRLTEASSNVQNKNLTSILREKSNSIMISSARKFERKSMMHKLSRNFLPLYVLWKTGKSSKDNDVVDHSLSAPIQRRSSYMALRSSAVSRSSRLSEASVSPDGQVLPQPPNLKVYKYSELKIATRNFRPDTMLGEGGFGKVFKGWVDGKPGSGTVVAVKKLNSQSLQGFQEWQSEVNFLGSLSHPNLVRLLGYCWEDKELLLVYEFMQKGSLENHLFGRGSHVQPLPWDIRLKILIGAAHGLAFLHAQDKKVIYRDFKASNILLDRFYHAKLSDFGLAKMGPTASKSHVTTQVMGTYGYAAPEYIATGHLYVKSDVYGFGVVLVEMLTGLRAFDTNRPLGQQNLVDWIKPHLSERRKLKQVIDTRLEGKFPYRSAFQVAQLALTCLESEPKDRPSMQEIVETLERIDSSKERPREPKAQSSHQTANRRGQQPLQYRSPEARR